MEITLESLNSSTETVTVSVVSTIVPPASSDANWILPRVTAADVADGENYLAIAASQTARPANAAATTIALAELPTWVSASGSLTGQHEWAAYSLRGPAQAQDWAIARTPFTFVSGRLRTTLVRSNVDMTASGEQSGTTEAIVVDASGRPLELSIPDQLQLRAVFVNGRAVSVPAADTLSIPLESSARPQTVVLHWTRHVDPLNRAGGLSPVAPQTVPAAENSVFAFAAPRNRWLVNRSEGLTSHEPEQAAITAEGLLQAFRNHANDEVAVAALWPALVALRDDFRNWLSASSADAARYSSLTDARIRQRIESTVTRIDDLVPVVARSAPAGVLRGVPNDLFAGRFRIEPSPANRNVLFGRPPVEIDSASSQIWQIDTLTVRWSTAVIAFAILVLVGWWASRRVDAIDHQWWTPFGWGILGIAWWLLMVPSIIGAAIIVAALVSMTGNRRNMADRESQHDSFALNA